MWSAISCVSAAAAAEGSTISKSVAVAVPSSTSVSSSRKAVLSVDAFHAKVALADQDLVYVGSANMTMFARHSMDLVGRAALPRRLEIRPT
jgi:Cu/Ag efflux protein CusF